MKPPRERVVRTFRDFDALSHDRDRVSGDKVKAVNHVSKKQLRASKTINQDVVFDPEKHKEFITGFRKRKQQRRNKAIKELEVKAKQDRLDYRAEKRSKLKEELGVGDNWGVDSSGGESDHGDDDQDVRVYAVQGVTTTVTTMALDSGPESSSSGEEEDKVGVQEERQKLKRPGVFPASSRAQVVGPKGKKFLGKPKDAEDGPTKSSAAERLQRLKNKLQKGGYKKKSKQDKSTKGKGGGGRKAPDR